MGFFGIMFLSNIKRRLSRQQIYRRYTGRLYVSSKFSLIFLSVVFVVSVIYRLANNKQYGGSIVGTFWSTPEFRWLGILVMIIIVSAPWLTIPMLRHILHRGPDRYVFRQDTWIIRLIFMGILTILSSIAVVLALPGLIITAAKFGYGTSILMLLSLIPIVFGSLSEIVGLIRSFILQKKGSLYPLTDFPTLRPQNTKFINLDVGALSPRLMLVNEIINSWQRTAEKWSPTSETVWKKASGLSDAIPSEWNHERWLSAWQGAEHLRITIANFLRVLPESIVFITSTTRAIAVAIESLQPSVIVTTNQEHQSEHRILDLMKLKYGATVIEVPILKDGKLDESWQASFIDRFVHTCVTNRANAALISHVCYANGWVLPVQAICRELKKMNPQPFVIIDGAHAVGQMNVDLSDFPVDFYAFCGHKWLFGPPTLGVSVLSHSLPADVLKSLKLEVYESLAFRGGVVDETTSSISLDPFVGLSASISGFREIGFNEIWDNIVNIRANLKNIINSYPNIEIIAFPARMQANGIINITSKGPILNIDQLKEIRNLLESNYEVVTKVVHNPLSLRLCLPFYLRYEELRSALSAINLAFGKF